jgi:hypothetical protein
VLKGEETLERQEKAPSTLLCHRCPFLLKQNAYRLLAGTFRDPLPRAMEGNTTLCSLLRSKESKL